MNSNALYLDDTYRFKSSGTLLSRGTDDRGEYGLVDQTIFYPQGGGQPCDTGELVGENLRVPISFVASVKGEIRHYGDFAQVEALPASVELHVDAEKRLTNARAHTAGHLIAGVVEKLFPHLIGVKGYHFPDGPYVEFHGDATDTEEGEGMVEAINRELDLALGSAAKVSPKSGEGNFRTVTIDSFPATPCGGTHLASLSELKLVVATKMKRKAGNIRVSYNVG